MALLIKIHISATSYVAKWLLINVFSTMKGGRIVDIIRMLCKPNTCLRADDFQRNELCH